ncbi:hypothetical protein N7447_011041 [Penicillium robsamsonii]|uniref:uncharacterized protein n=1 Tax=Penicillium robsamsonii TaxID=1792511 RepID=UPI00254955E1|nr:uncharacterized protein N7447_011041 [Penicillium robsamsonii]KAJ5807585.1 hypothetical protein N7447_011041 [Penicillium robsamsonii]
MSLVIISVLTSEGDLSRLYAQKHTDRFSTRNSVSYLTVRTKEPGRAAQEVNLEKCRRAYCQSVSICYFYPHLSKII